MNKPINFEWFGVNSIKDSHRDLPINQVYSWCITTDEKIIIVSKDGSAWQLPGGKPQPQETLEQTAIREIKEEAGINLKASMNKFVFIGYYHVTDPNNESMPDFLQIRMLLHLEDSSNELELSTVFEDHSQSKEDTIKFVKAAKVSECLELIPWLSKSGEFLELKSRGVV